MTCILHPFSFENLDLTKVPTNIARAICVRQLFLEVGKYFTRIRSVHICFLEKNQFFRHVRIEFFDKLNDLRMSSRFLPTKLIARKCQDFQSASTVIVSELGQLGIVGFGQSSFRGNIDQ